MTVAETLAPPHALAARWVAGGRAWCDGCGMPAVFTAAGWRHADGAGGALPVLSGGHRVTVWDWHEVGPLVDKVEWTPMVPVAVSAYQ